LHPAESYALFILALIVGITTSLGIALYRIGIHVFNDIFVNGTQSLLGMIVGKVTLVIGLAAAGYVVGWIMHRFVGEERHHGVAGIMESVALGGGRLRYEKLFFKALASSISLGAGASVGPEDPSVQIGANLGSMLGQRLRVSEDRMRLLVAAGAASAIAAAFNAPIAGVFFALEVILLEFTTNAFGVVVLAAVVASVLNQALEQTIGFHEPSLDLMNYTVGSPLEIPFYAVMGLVLAPIAAGFIRSVYWQKDVWHKHIHWPMPIQTAVAGAVVGLVGIFMPQILGTGREVMNQVLERPAEFTVVLLLVIGVTKIAMTGFSLAGGFVGGVFAPALFVGLVFGGVFGRLMEALNASNIISDPQVYAIVGMAAMMSGVVRSPITAIMLVFELTNDYRLILPIMLASVVCIFLTNRFAPLGIYALGLARAGVHLREGRDIDLMQGVVVQEVMDDPLTISEHASLVELRDALRRHHVRSICVTDGGDNLVGIVTLSDLQRAYEEHPEECATLTVGDIATGQVVTVHPDDVVWRAIRLMGANNVGRIPVVEERSNKLVGILSRHDIVEAYNKAIARKVQDQHNAEQVRLNNLTGAHVLETYVTDNAPVVGKRICDIRWPAESVVASIQRQNKLLVPHGNTALEAGDWVTLVAAPECEDELGTLFGQRPVEV
ncbi:MAG: chloride channel protein, partial [Anaerolineae bacterium]|nr:chloride channel protein [Anaerolineae bacterium]